MKIALLGYGKMGKMIEKFALDNQHEIVLKIDESNLMELTENNLKKADVAIEFSTPKAVLNNITLCLKAQVPIVIGTTGWYNQLENIQQQCREYNGTIIYGSNFSIGVNLFFGFNNYLAKVMGKSGTDYDVIVEEIHHTQKLDSPSGTAITIAEDLIKALPYKQSWKNTVQHHHANTIPNTTDEIPILSYREGEVPGTHIVRYQSTIDEIELKHTAKNREGFAKGAVIAAEWIKDKKGFYSVKDMFTF